MFCFRSGLDVLGEISLSNSRQSGFAKAAMECLLDSNLPAKYAMTGSLSSNNIIQDGFYDCGPVRRHILIRQKILRYSYFKTVQILDLGFVKSLSAWSVTYSLLSVLSCG